LRTAVSVERRRLQFREQHGDVEVAQQFLIY